MFSDFLVGLKLRSDLLCPDLSWTNVFSHRAREVSGVGNQRTETGYPKLVTTVENSITDQLATEVSLCGEVKSLVILSPLFDPDAEAVAHLAQRTNTPEVRIALPSGSELSTFPFTKTDAWPVRVSAVKSNKQDRRRLHAKWLEWIGTNGILSLTGSINATRQALSGINNIEIGVLRVVPVDKPWIDWQRATVPATYNECRFSRAGMGARLVFGELLGNGDLRGQIMSLTSPAGIWSGEIQRSNGEFIELIVTASADGRFYVGNLTADENFLLATGLQINLQKDGQVARGWITNTTILNLPKIYRISTSSLLRMLNREETDEDDIALLEYLAIYARDHLNIFRSRVIAGPSSPEDAGPGAEVLSIDLELLRPDTDVHLAGSHDRDPVMSTVVALERLFAQLRRRLLAHAPKRDGIATAPVGGASTDELDADEDIVTADKSRQRFDGAFISFMTTMKEFAESPALTEDYRRPLLVLWVEVALHMLVRRKRDRSQANAFLRTWFRTATTGTSIKDNIDSLEQHVVTAAAVLSANDDGNEMARAHLHEALEHYWRGTVNKERAASGLLPYSPLSIAALFLEDSQRTLQQHLNNVLESITLRHELEKLLDGDSLENSSPLFQCDAGKALRDELLKERTRRHIEYAEGNALCPTEFIKLSEACRGELQRNRVARCSVCGFLIVRISP